MATFARSLRVTLAAAALAGAAAIVRPPAAAAGNADDANVPDILLSRQLMARAHVAVGDIVTLAADPMGHRSARFRVAAVYEPTPDPMRFNQERLEARLHLDDLVALTADPNDPAAAESITGINIALADPASAEAAAAAIGSRVPGVEATPTARAGDPGVFAVLDRFHLAIASVTVAGSTAFLLALMVIRAEERRETVGVLRLIGISRRSILAEVIVEGLAVAACGALFGVIVALSAQHGVNRFFQARYDTSLFFVRVTPSIVLRSIAVAVPVGVAAGAAASWTLLRGSLVRR